jgi:pyrimidine-nucleoside phosphorylase
MTTSAVREAIEVKKAGGALSEELVAAVVAGYTAGKVPHEQMAALLMAILLRGMDDGETLALARAMADSGPRHAFGDCADKHSTGGVGDKVTLAALPIVAACGVPVAKLSGRGLGVTGGTIDKLEAIPGLSVALDGAQMRRQVDAIGLVIAEAGDIAPADKAIYALRDATGTVDSLPLVGSSVVAKKAATGAGAVLYDVKAGAGAFMTRVDRARELAALLLRLSEAMGIRAAALVTGMDAPLGRAVGNALEVRESVAYLRGEPADPELDEVVRAVSAALLELMGVAEPEEALERALASGAAYGRLAAMVRAQGGDEGALEDLPVAARAGDVHAPRDGWVARLDAGAIGRAAIALGAGRERREDPVDPGAGIELLVRVGDEVAAGAPVARLFGARGAERAAALVTGALEVSGEPAARPARILEGPSPAAPPSPSPAARPVPGPSPAARP